MTGKDYFWFWHASQLLRKQYDPNYESQPSLHRQGYQPVYMTFDGCDPRIPIRQTVGMFLDEYNRRHEIPITVDEYLEK